MTPFAVSPPSASSRLAFVLGGGGARGAMQVGALLALLEANIQPDILIGTSIGAVNAAMVAIHGFTQNGMNHLIHAWLEAKTANLLPGDYLRIAVRTMINSMGKATYQEEMRAFYVRIGIRPELQFRDFQHPKLYCVATDLNRYDTYIFGNDPEQFVLDGVLASAAIPPWIPPLRLGNELLMDGGALSNLPIEPAMRVGATEIVALDLFDPRPPDLEARGFSPFIEKLLTSVEHRQVTMELALARSRGIVVHHWQLRHHRSVPVWDFRDTEDLFQVGYMQGMAYLRQKQPGMIPATPGESHKRTLQAWWRRFVEKFR